MGTHVDWPRLVRRESCAHGAVWATVVVAFNVPTNRGRRLPHTLHVRDCVAMGTRVAQLLEVPATGRTAPTAPTARTAAPTAVVRRQNEQRVNERY